MRAEWLSFRVEEVSNKGTVVNQAVLPMSNVAHIQNESMSNLLGCILECWHLCEAGQITEFNVVVSLCTTMELDEVEADLMRGNAKKKGAARIMKHFV